MESQLEVSVVFDRRRRARRDVQKMGEGKEVMIERRSREWCHREEESQMRSKAGQWKLNREQRRTCRADSVEAVGRRPRLGSRVTGSGSRD